MKKYQGVGKSLQNLVEGQERNTVQLERIKAVMEWRWGEKEESKKEKDRDEERSKDGFRES